MPPCINKFYILDLQPESSLVRHTVDAGHQVFILSWRNADQSIAHKTWDDYVAGRRARSDRSRQRDHRREQINTLGFCIGGTILATALAVAAARGEHPATTMTLLTAMLDFSDTGVLDVFVDEGTCRCASRRSAAKAGGGHLLMGLEFANTFSYLRPNDLVWNYVVDNYLKGDAAGVRPALLEQRLDQPAGADVRLVPAQHVSRKQAARAGQGDDVRRTGRPRASTCRLSSTVRARTISCRGRRRIASAPLPAGPQKFVLGASGHIAGVINPPSKNKRSFWSRHDAGAAGAAGRLARRRDRASGKLVAHLDDLARGYAGKKMKAPATPGSEEHRVIEPAPGRYVLQRDVSAGPSARPALRGQQARHYAPNIR